MLISDIIFAAKTQKLPVASKRRLFVKCVLPWFYQIMQHFPKCFEKHPSLRPMCCCHAVQITKCNMLNLSCHLAGDCHHEWFDLSQM